MKKIFAAIAALILVFGFVAFRTAEKKLADILKQLGIRDQEAKEYVFSNFQNGSLQFPYSQAVKKLAVGQRAEAVNEIGTFIRKYTESSEFISQYNEARNASKPQEPESLDEYVKKRIEELKTDIANSEEEMKKASGDMKKLYEATIKMQKDQLKVLQNPKDPMFAMYAGKDKEMEEQEWRDYKQALKEYEVYFPSNPKDLIKIRLKEFLDMTATIDFDAKLVSKYGKMRFQDPQLEAKSSEWKMCFRSGKETIAAARAFAQQWLKELK
jgi:hypothetical protein